MSRFFIKQISVTGEKVLFSEVSFNDGVNIIYGPSNAGKSYIINCINFMFAGDPPFTKSSTGYDAMATELNTDVFEKENEEDGESAKFKGRELINKDTWKVLSDNLNSMIKECGYPNSPESRLNIDTLDVVVGGKFKKDQGKGYRAYLNTIMLFNLMKYLEENAIYAPHLLILDSPILSLKEKKHKITEKEKATPGMRESLFKYIVNHYGKNQVIIAENEIPEGVDYSFVNLIEYTTDEREGTYGFLKSVKN